jgi:hypothetical protein
VLPLSDPEHFEDEGDNGPELPRTLSPSIVKQQNKERLNAALAEFGKPLVTLRDAANYITKLPKAEHEVAEWQTAMEMLSVAAASTRTWQSGQRAPCQKAVPRASRRTMYTCAKGRSLAPAFERIVRS